jgi:uncharacterized membrane protein YgdD (TMEM256/DUF423 family)
MNARFLILGAVVGGLVIFLWGAVTHAVLPQPLHYFTDEPLLIEAIRGHTTGNGVYFASRGVFAAIAFRPDFADKTLNLAPNLIIQFCSDALGALLLSLIVARIHADSVLERAGWLLLMGVAAFVIKFLPYWNWYGFSAPFVAMEALDLVGKFFIGGLVLGGLFNRMTKGITSRA